MIYFDPNVMKLLSTKGNRKFLHRRGKLVEKPRIKLGVDALEFEVVDGKCLVTLNVEGSNKHLPPTVKIRINSKLIDIAPNETIELKSNVTNRLTVKIEDDRVFTSDKPISVMAVPKGEVGKPPRPRPEPIDDGIIVERK